MHTQRVRCILPHTEPSFFRQVEVRRQLGVHISFRLLAVFQTTQRGTEMHSDAIIISSSTSLPWSHNVSCPADSASILARPAATGTHQGGSHLQHHTVRERSPRLLLRLSSSLLSPSPNPPFGRSMLCHEFTNSEGGCHSNEFYNSVIIERSHISSSAQSDSFVPQHKSFNIWSSSATARSFAAIECYSTETCRSHKARMD